jgi:hypothetical protein
MIYATYISNLVFFGCDHPRHKGTMTSKLPFFNGTKPYLRWCPRELFTLSWCVYNSHFTRVYGRYSISNYLLWFINQQTSLGGGTTLQVSQHFFQLSQLFGIYVGLALEGTQKIPWHFFMEINLKAPSRAEWATSATGKKNQGCPE